MAKLGPAIVAAITFLTMFALYHRESGFNNFWYLAQAFLQGRVWIDWPGENIDALLYHGRRYVIEGPLPAVLMMPAVAIWKDAASQTILSQIFGALAAAAGWDVARRLGVGVRTRIVLIAFLLLGTDLFWCALFGDVWFIAHAGAVAFTLLAIDELIGSRRGWLVMLWAVCAFECRFTMVLAIPIYLTLLYTQLPRSRRRFAMRGAFVVLGVAAIAWAGYNQARWGVPYDLGYTAFYHKDPVGSPVGSPFQLRYLPDQLTAFFITQPEFSAKWPYVVPSQYATALTWTSPALILAFLARKPLPLAIAMALATLLCAGPNLVYYVVGFAQFGMRHALDFEPFLFVLMCLGVRTRLLWWQAALCIYSALAGAWGVWYWLAIVRA